MAKILLVEDDNNLREIYGARLMAEGFTIVAAADGEEALAMAVKEKPDLIISDVMMPKISGFDMLDILRTTAETKNTKVIMMTALSQPEDRERGEKLGADRYLVKSQVTLEDVVAVVHEVLGDGAATPAPAPAATIVNPDAADATKAKDKAATPAPSTTKPETPAVAPATPPPAATTPKPSVESSAPAEPAREEAPAVIELAETEGEDEDKTPEPASKKKKVIEPINDLSKTGDNLDKLVQEEAARENESTPGAAIPPSVGNKPDIAETIAQEKEEMEEQIKDFVDKTSNDAPSEAAPVTDSPVDDASTTEQTPQVSPTPATPAPAAAIPSPTAADTSVETPAPTSDTPQEPAASPAVTPTPVPAASTPAQAPSTDTATPAPEPTQTPPAEPTTPTATPATPPTDPNAPNPNDIAL